MKKNKKPDKVNGDVLYYDDEHIYVDKQTQDKFISVTTLIHNYTYEFDSAFWSAYKALEALMEESDFSILKKSLLATKKFHTNILNKFGIDNEEFINKRTEILLSYDEERDKSCARGTAIHADFENKYYQSDKHNLSNYGLDGQFTCKPHYYELDLEKGIYPEYLIYRTSSDGVLKVAGQIDLLVKDGNDIYIYDYKGLPLDTPLATPNGWTYMKDICKGDVVFDKYGKETKVLHVSDVHNNPCYKINFDNSEHIICDHEHRWEISFRKGKDSYIQKVMTTEELLHFMNTHDRTSYNIPKILNANPIETSDACLPIDPYILGAWLGDGSKNTGIITNNNPRFWTEVIKRGYSYGENLNEEGSEMRTIYNIRRLLNELGILNNKFIPDIYLRASYAQRLDMLRGLMDTDGYYHSKRKRFVMNTDQEWQANDLVRLVASLGWKPTKFEVINKCNGKEFQGWNVCFYSTENPFLIRNQEISWKQKKDRNSFRIIESIEKVETVPTKCIEVDSDTHTYLAGYSMIPTHNTNKEIKQKSYFNRNKKSYECMKFPLNNVMDCNYMHYSLQLSLYAYLLQQINPEFNIKLLKLIHIDHNNKQTDYELEYMKERVEIMLKHYKKQLKIKMELNRNTPVKF